MILLDTNALLWALSQPAKLGTLTTTALTESPDVRYSPLSITEVRIKELLGRLTVPGDLLEKIHAAGFKALPYREDHADGLKDFPQLLRHDPFDRMILAQATVQGCALYTSDATLLGLGLSHVHDCRQ